MVYKHDSSLLITGKISAEAVQYQVIALQDTGYKSSTSELLSSIALNYKLNTD